MKLQKSHIKLPELPGLKPGLAQDYCYQRLRHALMVGAINPGIAITIQEIAVSFDVSTTPVREALRQLCSEKALFALKNRRIQVPEMTRVRFNALLDLRCRLETFAAKCTLPYVSSVKIDGLDEIDRAVDDACTSNNWDAMVILNQQFHSELYQIYPDQVVMPMIESLWLQLGPFMRIAAKFQKELFLVDHHKAAIEALRLNDATKLELAIEADIRSGIDQLTPQMLEAVLQDQASIG
jgi:DNA-binding GntR family transcriptional regulator